MHIGVSGITDIAEQKVAISLTLVSPEETPVVCFSDLVEKHKLLSYTNVNQVR